MADSDQTLKTAATSLLDYIKRQPNGYIPDIKYATSNIIIQNKNRAGINNADATQPVETPQGIAESSTPAPSMPTMTGGSSGGSYGY